METPISPYLGNSRASALGSQRALALRFLLKLDGIQEKVSARSFLHQHWSCPACLQPPAEHRITPFARELALNKLSDFLRKPVYALFERAVSSRFKCSDLRPVSSRFKRFGCPVFPDRRQARGSLTASTEVPFTEEAWRWVLYGLLAALQMVMSAVVQRLSAPGCPNSTALVFSCGGSCSAASKGGATVQAFSNARASDKSNASVAVETWRANVEVS